MSSGRALLVPSQTEVRSITYSHEPLYRVVAQARVALAVLIDTDDLHAVEAIRVSINCARLAASTASLAPRDATTRAIEARSTTTDFSAHNTMCAAGFAHRAAAALVSCRQRYAQPVQQYTVTTGSSVAHPIGTCASFGVTVSQEKTSTLTPPPTHPQLYPPLPAPGPILSRSSVKRPCEQ